MNHYIVKQTSGKRFLAGLFDALFVGLLSLLVYIPMAAITTYSGWGLVATQLYAHGIKSGLYEANELGGLNEIKDEARLPKVLYDFYVDMNIVDGALVRGYAPLLAENSAFNTAEDYYIVILGKGSDDTLFDFSLPRENEYNIPAKSGKESEVKAFYKAEVIKAHTLFNKHELIDPLYTKHYTYYFITVFGTFYISAFILTVLLPLAFKDKATLGKKITGTIVVNSLGYKVKNSQLFFRNLAIFFFSYVFFFMPFHLISFMLGMFSKNNASMYDRLAVTIVADKKKSLVFLNIDEETAYRKKLAGQLLEVERRKKEAREADDHYRATINLKD